MLCVRAETKSASGSQLLEFTNPEIIPLVLFLALCIRRLNDSYAERHAAGEEPEMIDKEFLR